MAFASDFATRLRWWRQQRGWSQLELAGRAEVSQRHVSFLELARAKPSREMVMRLASTLGVALREQNALLLAAGFAPAWKQSDLAAPELAGISAALDHMMAQQEPFPAVVVDRNWNLLRSNRGAGRLVAFLVGPLPPDAAINLADALIAPDVLRPYLVNWEPVVRYFIRSVEADAAADGTAASTGLLQRLSGYPGVRAALRNGQADEAAGPVLAMHFRKDDISLQLFTTIATLGTPRDITLQELRIECFFPANNLTATLLRNWAAPGELMSHGLR